LRVATLPWINYKEANQKGGGGDGRWTNLVASVLMASEKTIGISEMGGGRTRGEGAGESRNEIEKKGLHKQMKNAQAEKRKPRGSHLRDRTKN